MVVAIPTRYAERLEEHYTRDRGLWYTTEEHPITPLAELQTLALIAESPLDALCRWCDAHMWHIRRYREDTADVFSTDRLEETSIRAVPLDDVVETVIDPAHPERGTKRHGTYRVEVA